MSNPRDLPQDIPMGIPAEKPKPEAPPPAPPKRSPFESIEHLLPTDKPRSRWYTVDGKPPPPVAWLLDPRSLIGKHE